MPRRLDAVDAAAREPARLVSESRSCRDGVVPTQAEDRHRKQMRRAQMEARIQRNMAQAAKMEEKRKEHFWQKKAHHEVRDSAWKGASIWLVRHRRASPPSDEVVGGLF